MKIQLIPVLALAMTATGALAAEPAAVTPQEDDFTPMTRSEQVGEYVRETFSPKAVVESGIHAELGVIQRSPREWGGGAVGFGSRMGSNMAQHVLRGTLRSGAAALLHEDNRYRASNAKGFWKRTKYAVISSFLARKDNGHRRLGFSKIGSAGATAFISRAWLPRTVATVGGGASSFGLTIAADVGANLLHEFWPDLKRRFGRK